MKHLVTTAVLFISLSPMAYAYEPTLDEFRTEYREYMTYGSMLFGGQKRLNRRAAQYWTDRQATLDAENQGCRSLSNDKLKEECYDTVREIEQRKTARLDANNTASIMAAVSQPRIYFQPVQTQHQPVYSPNNLTCNQYGTITNCTRY